MAILATGLAAPVVIPGNFEWFGFRNTMIIIW
jgi:hypothetical protein